MALYGEFGEFGSADEINELAKNLLTEGDKAVEYIKAVCLEDDRMAKAVRKKGKTLKGCIGKILKWAFKNQQPVDKDIIKAAGVKAGKVTLGMPGQAKARELIRSYYGGAK